MQFSRFVTPIVTGKWYNTTFAQQCQSAFAGSAGLGTWCFESLHETICDGAAALAAGVALTIPSLLRSPRPQGGGIAAAVFVLILLFYGQGGEASRYFRVGEAGIPSDEALFEDAVRRFLQSLGVIPTAEQEGRTELSN